MITLMRKRLNVIIPDCFNKYDENKTSIFTIS